MKELAPIRVCSPLDYRGVDGVPAARGLHFGAFPRFRKFVWPLSPFKEEAIRAFIDHAVSGAEQDPAYFAEDFGPRALADGGWCGTVTRQNLADVADLLGEADEIEVGGDLYGGTSTIKTLGQMFVVNAIGGVGWDLMQEIHLGQITLTHETRPVTTIRGGCSHSAGTGRFCGSGSSAARRRARPRRCRTIGIAPRPFPSLSGADADSLAVR